MTDAPNAIVSCVSTKCISMKKAVFLAAVSDLAGSLTFGLLNGNVSKTVMDIAFTCEDSKMSLVCLSAAMFSVVIWAVAAWIFGIPTSESHALISALAGTGVALNGGLFQTNTNAWNKVIWGLVVSVLLGVVAGCITTKLTFYLFKYKNNDMIFIKSQIVSSALMSFMHGAQDSQKFTGILMLAISSSGYADGKVTPLWLYFLCPLFIAAGTLSGGERIIKVIGNDMLKMEKSQGFSSDIAGSLCLLISTLMGMPVSTTHTKTSAVIGAGIAKNLKDVNWKIAAEMVIAWLVTFPACGALGYLIARIFLRL